MKTPFQPAPSQPAPAPDPPRAAAVGLFGFLSRRRLLKLGLGGAGLLLGAGGGLLGLRGCAPPVEGLRALSDHQFRTLANLARVHLPAGGAFEEGADGEELARAFDRYLADEPPHAMSDLQTALTLVELGPVVFDGRLTTFSNLPSADQHAHWAAWLSSDMLLRRQVGLAFRKFLSLVFFDRPSVWPHIGYPGPTLRS